MIYFEWYGVCNFVVFSVVEICVSYLFLFVHCLRCYVLDGLVLVLLLYLQSGLLFYLCAFQMNPVCVVISEFFFF